MSRHNESLTVAEAVQPDNQIISQTVGRPDTHTAWQDLETDVPTLRSDAEVAAFAECVLVELRYESRRWMGPLPLLRFILCIDPVHPGSIMKIWHKNG
jgi:hypothetical protein